MQHFTAYTSPYLLAYPHLLLKVSFVARIIEYIVTGTQDNTENNDGIFVEQLCIHTWIYVVRYALFYAILYGIS